MGLICLRVRATYSNLSRYSELSEKTYLRWFGKKLDFIEFNRLGIQEIIPATHAKIAALDASFMEKSGKKMDGLGKFYNSKQSKAEKGLEISTLAVVDVDYNTAYQLSTRQINACFTALNLIKWQDRLASPLRKPISVISWKARFFNALFIERTLLNF